MQGGDFHVYVTLSPPWAHKLSIIILILQKGVK